ncbi:MAG TPA: ABC-F family ATP-binding cassette domain-containing protein [Candidatus Binatia bacterium]|nr:ABC-F family ATP-binding cassette domain-containing protein [Candidatus Binatia bacterium]
MLSLEDVSRSFGGQTVLDGCRWRVGRGVRIGLVGPNGAGKTTLCRIMAGADAPDRGRVHVDSGVTVGYLPQEVAVHSDHTVLAEALSGFAEVWRLERELEALAAAMADQDAPAVLTERYGETQHRFEALGGYRLEAEAKVILGGLGFAPPDVHRPLGELSGGWRMRATLARLLLLHPDLLLLDEPTNHLDLVSLEWLESFLAAYDGSVVLVSHDRYFLNRMVTGIAELDRGQITEYTGDYDDYLVEREARRALVQAQAQNQARRIAEIERFIERFRAKATKARQVQSRIKMLDRVERIEVVADRRGVRFHFPAPPRTGRTVARLTGIHKAYGGNVVYAGIDLAVERGERVALVGVNGAGKSTLLKILAGVTSIDRGTRELGANVHVHYYAQHQLDALDPARTVFEELVAAAPDLPTTRLRTVLGAFLFSGDDVDKRVAVLSGGEKARVALARMLVRPAALLCLDEPTNHLDLSSKDVLEEALANFPGTIVFISHDRYFINRIATQVIEVADGRLSAHLGNYDDYQARRGVAASTAAAAPAPAAPPPAGGAPGGGSARGRRGVPAARRTAGAEVRKLRERLSGVEGEIAVLEERLADLVRALGDPELYRNGERAREMAHARKESEEQMARLMKEWEDVSGRLGSVEAME